MQFAKPRGTRDFLPREMAKRRQVEEVMRGVFERFGYKEIQTPTFESLELITAKSGEDIRRHLYHFEDKSGRKLALRPELTAPAVRLYINEMQFKPKPVKIYYFGNCFRYERPQSGRFREFWQAGIELIGADSPEAEAEVIAIAVEALHKIKLKDFKLHVGNIGVLRKILENSGVGEKEQNIVMGIIDKGEEGELERLLHKLKVSEENREVLLNVLELVGDRSEILDKAKLLLKGNKHALVELKRFEEVLRILEAFGVEEYTIDLGIARGLDYYTGMVFEIYASKLGAQKQICGGGSYSLVQVFGGESTPTCGFAFGFDRILLALENFKVDKKTKVFVVPTTERLLNEAIKVSSLLRQSIVCEVDLMRRKLSKALGYADAKKIPYVVIVGEEEFKEGKVVLRDMKTGEQKKLGVKELKEFLGGVND
jgi:histidyl-tRNA synthetase